MNRDVNEFWFGNERRFRPEWFMNTKEFDDEVTSRFADRIEQSIEQVPSSHFERLGLIILVDQFPRHVYRGSPRSFQYDYHALQLVKSLPLIEDCGPFDMFEAYFYMLPFEHSENIEDQHAFLSFIDLLSRTYGTTQEQFVQRAREIAVRHKDTIERFGRFPHRNSILGRTSTDEELDFLSPSYRP